jgi:hypothetical protein
VETGKQILISQVELIDPSLEVTDPGDCHLSVSISPKSLNFTLFRKATQKFVLLAAYSGDLEMDFSAGLVVLDQLTGNFESVSISVDLFPASLIPTNLFDDALLEPAAKLIFGPLPANQIKVEHAEIAETVIVYQKSEQLENTLLKKFPHATLHHQDWYRIESDLRRFKKENRPVVLVSRMQGNMHILIISNQKILLCNKFAVDNTEAFAYFLLNAIQTINLQVGDFRVVLRGAIEKGSDEAILASKYLGKIEFDKLPDTFKYSHEFHDIPAHRYSELFYQYSCVS